MIAAMNYDCVCGHKPVDHGGKYGRCEGQCYDPEYGTFACLCFAYEKGDQ